MITKLRSAILIALAVFAVSGLQSCKDDTTDTGNQPTKSISEYLTDDGGYTEFLAALETAGLTSKISGSGAFMLLAVSDFQLTDDGVDLSSMTDAEVTAWVKYHFMEGKRMPSNFTHTGYTASESTNGPNGERLSIYTNVEGSAVRFNGKAASTNYEATNGIVYVMAGSLSLPTLLDHLAINPNLAEYKIGINMESAMKTALGTGPNTVFAVNQADFVAYLETQNIIRIADLTPSIRRTILNNSLIFGSAKATSSLSGNVSTEGADMTITTGASGLQINGKVNIIRENVYGTDGILHVIDDVIL